MNRGLSLFGMILFTAGVVALAALAKNSASRPRLPEAAAPPRDCPRLPEIPSLFFHARFSVN